MTRPFLKRTALQSLLALAALVLAGCGAPSEPPTPDTMAALPGEHVVFRPDLQAVFDSAGAVGVFVGYDPLVGVTLASDTLRAARRFVPASTFKLLNALVALETGAVPSAQTTLP